MKKIKFDSNFKKQYQKRVQINASLRKLFIEIVDLLIENRFDPYINDHKLMKPLNNYRSFGPVDRDLRIIYREAENEFIFLRVGNHQEVYN